MSQTAVATPVTVAAGHWGPLASDHAVGHPGHESFCRDWFSHHTSLRFPPDTFIYSPLQCTGNGTPKSTPNRSATAARLFQQMHVSQSRFDLTKSDKAGIQAFLKHIWYNSEVCSNCFTRVRAIGDVVTVETDVHSHELAEFYERTERASQEHTPFEEPSARYGTCFCDHCGADLRPHHHNLPWETMREHAKRLLIYTNRHTSLSIDREAFARSLAHLRLNRRDTGGKESQIFAVAFSRALTTEVTGRGTIREQVAATND